ncbi:unnamed protein product [Lepeophtheirus salmonis]|uniref:(salmon louse) hypothetical protein n=1 Tax=Lepeophtheirus salmonis TaxID=72036 RepID=A0A7R8CJE8_LEPSM|nr:unnamed protein product [Lepeophtheirus salmonis]CAF2840685.1 unnamed protein product [Lepeophtheirus salmonis]
MSPSKITIALLRKQREYFEESLQELTDEGWSGVLYGRVVLNDESIKVGFLTSLPRVRPPKGITIPRLELEAALLKVYDISKNSENHFMSLSQGDLLSNKDSLSRLDIVWDTHDQLISFGGRLNNIEILPSYTRRLMLVSNLSRFAVLLIEHEHPRLLHSGPATTFVSLHSRYWIVERDN